MATQGSSNRCSAHTVHAFDSSNASTMFLDATHHTVVLCGKAVCKGESSRHPLPQSNIANETHSIRVLYGKVCSSASLPADDIIKEVHGPDVNATKCAAYITPR